LGEDNQGLHVTGEIQCDCGSNSSKIKFVADISYYDKEHLIKAAEIDEQYFLIVKNS